MNTANSSLNVPRSSFSIKWTCQRLRNAGPPSKLKPKPQAAQVALAAFDDIAAAGAAVASVIAAGIVPAGLEMMDRKATRAVEEFVHAGYPLDAAWFAPHVVASRRHTA